jgi:hypothetical protein
LYDIVVLVEPRLIYFVGTLRRPLEKIRPLEDVPEAEKLEEDVDHHTIEDEEHVPLDFIFSLLKGMGG